MFSEGLNQPLLQPDSADNFLGVQSDSDHDSPECLLLLQPAGDDYSSDPKQIKLTESYFSKKVHSVPSHLYKSFEYVAPRLWNGLPDKEKLCVKTAPMCPAAMSTRDPRVQNPSVISSSFMAKKMNCCFAVLGKNMGFMKNEALTLEECLGEMLHFSLQSNRRTLSDEITRFDGFSIKEIISMWKRFLPCLGWLLENFNFNLIPDKTKIDLNSAEKIKALKMLRKERFEFHCNMPDEELEQFRVRNRCLQFVKQFISTMDKLQESCSGTKPGEEAQDKFKPVWSLLAGIIDLPHRLSGQCRLTTQISEVGQTGVITHTVNTSPDFVFMNSTEDLHIPVEEYVPQTDQIEPSVDGSPSTEGSERTFGTQHLMQHIALLSSSMVKSSLLTDAEYLTEQQTSVGLFVQQNEIHFSKVVTTPSHVSSFVLDLMPEEKDGDFTDVAVEMKRRLVKDGIEATRSCWSLDLHLGVHRNALLLFLLHYLHGKDCNK